MLQDLPRLVDILNEKQPNSLAAMRIIGAWTRIRGLKWDGPFDTDDEDTLQFHIEDKRRGQKAGLFLSHLGSTRFRARLGAPEMVR